MGFLINDMLDYAQLSAGQFRKCFNNFNLIQSVADILKIMQFKADELGINIQVDFENINSNKS